MKTRLSAQDRLDVCRLYAEGKTQQQIGDMYGEHRITILRVLHRQGVKCRDASNWARKYEINEGLFERVDCEWKAYLLGLIYADGAIATDLDEVSIQLNENDKGILQFFNNLIYNGQKELEYCKGRKYRSKKTGVESYTKPSYRLRIHSKKVAGDLVRLGVVPHKSLILPFPTESMVPSHLLHHFVRGYFDGDGNIYHNKHRKAWHIIGTFSFCKSLRGWLKAADVSSSVRSPKKENISRLYCYANQSLTNLYRLIYSDATIFLERKQQAFLRVVDGISSRSSNLRAA